MSRELLKRAAAILHAYFNGANWVKPLLNEIETYLSQPDDPVAWIGEGLIVRSSEDLKILRQHEPGLASLYNTPLYTSPPDQSARVAELTADSVRLMETITELRSNLAALQAKREPLTWDELQRLSDECDIEWSSDTINFARAIEAAHGITGGEK